MSIMLLSYDINANTYRRWCDDDDAHGSSDFTADIIDAIIGVDKSVELSVIRAMTSAAAAAAQVSMARTLLLSNWFAAAIVFTAGDLRRLLLMYQWGVFSLYKTKFPNTPTGEKSVCMCVGFDITAPKLLTVRSSKFCSGHL